jgi:hypothetical protein
MDYTLSKRTSTLLYQCCFILAGVNYFFRRQI